MPTLNPFQDELYLPSTLTPLSDDGQTCVYRITLKNGRRKLHSQLPETPFWGYEGQYPGPTIDITRDREVQVTFFNDLEPPSDLGNPRTQWPFAIAPDDTGDGAMPYFVPPTPWTVVHLHGSPNRPEYDGWADNAYYRGESATHHYPRQERAALYWYHDHANMITRLNVYAGLAGLYFVRDASEESGLPSGKYEIPLVLQDRDFEVDGSGAFTGKWAYQSLTSNTIFERSYFLVNGMVTPYKDVERTTYRLRFVNGANSRFFRLAFRVDGGPVSTGAWEVRGVDGGKLAVPVMHPQTTLDTGPKDMVVLAPAERLDVLVDFSQFAAGAHVVLANLKSNGTYDKPIMDFRVQEAVVPFAPATATIGTSGSVAATVKRVAARSPRLASPYASVSDDRQLTIALSAVATTRTRTIGLYVRDGMQTLNGAMFHDTVEEIPELEQEEIWEFLNLTNDSHPIHLHLVNFQIIDRQKIIITDPDQDTYIAGFHEKFHTWLADPSPTKPRLPPGLGFDAGSSPIPADAYEKEPKDTVRVPKFNLTRIKTKFRLHTGVYMYHCHILEHEDMEMMRPMLVVPKGMPSMTHGGHEAGSGGHHH